MVRTPKQALAFVRKHRVVPMTPSGDLPCLVVAIAGSPVKGSWWGHPRGALIYDLANSLDDSTEVRSVRLVDGKSTFVHRSLWPALYRVVRDPAWRRSKTDGLTALAKRLLGAVERAGRLRLDSWAGGLGLDVKALRKARERLARDLLVDSSSVHTTAGSHATILVAWDRWADPAVRRAAKTLDFKEARDEIHQACRGRAGAI